MCFMRQIVFLITLTAFMTVIDSAFAGMLKGNVKVRGLRTTENIVIYVTKAPEKPMDFSKSRFVVDQKNLSFLPQLLIIPVGATVYFPNNDKVDHNVFSLSRTKKFNLSKYGPGKTKTVTFEKPGMVELRCDMHAEMSGFILVMKNIYFGITDKDGQFVIPDNSYLKKYSIKYVSELPAGKYTIRTWHEKLKSIKKTIIVPDSGDVVLDLNLTRGTPGKLYKQ